MLINQLFRVDGSPDWEFIRTIPQFNILEGTQQSTVWHGEGNVWNHVKMVTEKMIWLLDNEVPFRTPDTVAWFMQHPIDRTALLAAAICHDLGKGTCTRWDDGLKEWKTKNHGVEGEKITRKLFFDDPNVKLREKICWLVRNHMALHHVFDTESKIQERLWRIQHGNASVLDLCYLNYADSMGSINDESKDGDRIITERLINVLSACDANGQNLDGVRYKLYGHSTSDDLQCYENRHSTIYFMMGIAGSGKSTWIQNNVPNLPVVSRDIARAELGYIKPGEKAKLSKKQEEKVTEYCREKQRYYASRAMDFIIDDMNLKKCYRDEFHSQMTHYLPEYTYVYVEAPSLKDNETRRNGQISKGQIVQMLDNLEFPEPYEYNYLIVSKQTNA